jgi:RNA polymerase sigma factor (sigma-70 family)
MKLVYGVCRRALGDVQLAEDATQAVFLLLAQKARSVGRSVSISGWLFNAARLVSRNAIRTRNRIHCVEEEAMKFMTDRLAPEAGKEELELRLNDALAVLTPAEREVILLRYFEELSFREIAGKLGTAENTAGKRAGYAIEKMRRYLVKTGIAVSVVSLTAFLADQQAQAVPITCRAATLEGIHQFTAAHAASAAASHVTALQKGVYIVMQATTYKVLIAGSVALFLGLLTFGGVLGWNHFVAGRSVPGSFTDLTGNLAIAASNAGPQSDPHAIAEQLKQMVDAINDHNTDEITSHIADDAYFPQENKPAENKGQLVQEARQEFTLYPQRIRYVTLQSLNLQGDRATTVMVVRYGGGPPTGPAAQRYSFRTRPDRITVQWVKRNGQWLVEEML